MNEETKREIMKLEAKDDMIVKEVIDGFREHAGKIYKIEDQIKIIKSELKTLGGFNPDAPKPELSTKRKRILELYLRRMPGKDIARDMYVGLSEGGVSYNIRKLVKLGYCKYNK